MDDSLLLYNASDASSPVTKAWNFIQSDVCLRVNLFPFLNIYFFRPQFDCCGVNKSSDYSETAWGKANPGRVPASCCKDPNTGGLTCDVAKSWDTGCFAKAQSEVQIWMLGVGALIVVVLLVSSL